MNSNLTIELIHPPHPDASEDRLDVPMGLLYVAANLEKHGYNVRINDLSGVPEEKWEIGKADVYGITIYVTTINLAEKIALLCKTKNEDCKVVAGGAHPTALPESMSSVFDVVVIGEGESAMLEVVNDFPHNKRYYEVPLSKNLDLYPNPAYHLVDLKTYKRTIFDESSLTVITSRGCPYRCAFCGLPKHHKIMKTRSPEAVAEEIQYLKEKYGVTKFNFQDDTFTCNKKRLYELLELLKPLNISFKCHGRAGLDTREDYRRLKESGCEVIAWGTESGSQKILDRMNKQASVQDNENVIKWAKEFGILTRCFFILGFPGETKETLEETKRFIERTGPDQYFVSNFVPFPDTDVWNNPEKYGIIWMNKNFDNYYQINKTGHGSVNIETSFLSPKEFIELERDFRSWIKQRGRKGPLLEYEKELEEN